MDSFPKIFILNVMVIILPLVLWAKKGRRFGGYTVETWAQSKSWKKGPNSFIFSMDNGGIYYYKNKNSIFLHNNENPNFLLYHLISNIYTFGVGHYFKLCVKFNEYDAAYERLGRAFDTSRKTYALAGKQFFYI